MRRPLQLSLAALVAAGAAFGGVTAVQALDDERPASIEPAYDQAPGAKVEPTAARLGTDSVEAAVADPRGRGGPPWAVVVYRSRDDRPCAVAGQVVGGKVGALVDDRFHEYPLHEGGSCVDLDRVPAGVQVTQPAAGDAPTVAHGLAGPQVKSISVTAGEQSVTPKLGPRGGFVVPLAPGTRIEDVDVVAVLRDGSSVTLF